MQGSWTQSHRYFQQPTQEGTSQQSTPADATNACRSAGTIPNPTPRRLHFPTELNAHEGRQKHPPAPAMTPSPKARAKSETAQAADRPPRETRTRHPTSEDSLETAEEEAPELDEEFAVDFF